MHPPAILATADISDEFYVRLAKMGQKQKWNTAFLLAVMAKESGLQPGAINHSGPAYGLIQFFGQGHAFIADLSAEEQVPYIESFYAADAPYGSIGETYGHNYLPNRMRARGRAPDTVLSVAGEEYYDQNASLDTNHDGKITIADLEQAALTAAKRLGARYTESLARLEWAKQSLGGGGESGGGNPLLIVSTLALGALAFTWFRR
jgi:hypothetical protein